MMYPYLTFNDDTEVTHSGIIEDGDVEKVLVQFERPTEAGFDSIRCEPTLVHLDALGRSVLVCRYRLSGAVPSQQCSPDLKICRRRGVESCLGCSPSYSPSMTSSKDAGWSSTARAASLAIVRRFIGNAQGQKGKGHRPGMTAFSSLYHT